MTTPTERISYLEGAIQQMNVTLESIQRGQEALSARIDARIDGLSARIDTLTSRVDSQMRTIILVGAAFLTALLGAIVPLYFI